MLVHMTSSTTTSAKLSRETLVQLEHLRQEMNTKSIDETIRELIRKSRRSALTQAFGIDKGKLKPFATSDRGEDR
jgi:hypothetical protein